MQGCAPCSVLKVRIKEVLTENEYEFIDLLENRVNDLRIRSVPTLILDNKIYTGVFNILNAITDDKNKQ